MYNINMGILFFFPFVFLYQVSVLYRAVFTTGEGCLL